MAYGSACVPNASVPAKPVGTESAFCGRQGGAVLVSAPSTPNALPVVAPDARGLGLVAHQPGGAPALRPGDGRVTGLSYSGGLLWAGPVPFRRGTAYYPHEGLSAHVLAPLRLLSNRVRAGAPGDPFFNPETTSSTA